MIPNECRYSAPQWRIWKGETGKRPFYWNGEKRNARERAPFGRRIDAHHKARGPAHGRGVRKRTPRPEGGASLRAAGPRPAVWPLPHGNPELFPPRLQAG